MSDEREVGRFNTYRNYGRQVGKSEAESNLRHEFM